MKSLPGSLRGALLTPAIGFALASVLSLALFAALLGNAVAARQASRQAIEDLRAREFVQTELVRLDALLQSTALAATATGEAEGWADTHARAAARVDALFDRLREDSTSPDLRTALDLAEAARDIKTSSELRALEALSGDHPETARRFVQRAEYHEQSHQFAHAMQHFESAQLEATMQGVRRADARLERSILWATGLFVLVTGLWIALLRASRQRERQREIEIAARSRGQRALAESLSLYRSLFEGSNDIVLLVDRTSARIVDANEHACVALGHRRPEILELGFDALCATELDATEDEQGVSTHLVRGDGSRMPVVLRGRPVRTHGMDCVQIAARDLSVCRSLETQLQQAQRVESVGQLACGVAHEFSNLALVLAGQAGLIRNAMRDHRSVSAQLERIEAVAAEARRISRSLMRFSGRSRPDPHPVDVRAVARDTVDLLVHVLPPTIQLEVDGLDDEPLWALSDEGDIEQILLNLALNARDAMPSGGTLWISCTPGDHGELEIVVGDTGSGIPDDDLGMIFEPLFTTKPAGSGTGLGLSVVDRIVRQLDGRIDVRTRVEQGSTFTITLPLHCPAKDSPAPEGEGGSERAISVRLALDSAPARHLLRTEFESRGHRVSEVTPGSRPADRVDVAILAGSPAPTPRHRLNDRLGADHVVWISASADEAESATEEAAVLSVGPSVPLEELVRIAENLARLGTGERT